MCMNMCVSDQYKSNIFTLGHSLLTLSSTSILFYHTEYNFPMKLQLV